MMKSKQEYEDFKQHIIDQDKQADHYISRAEELELIHKRIRNKKGIYKILDKLVLWMRKDYYKLGQELTVKGFKECITEIDELQKFLKEKA